MTSSAGGPNHYSTSHFSQPKFLVCLLSVVAFALALRLMFGAMVYRQLSPEAFREVHGDTNGYLKLARNIDEGKQYAATNAALTRDGVGPKQTMINARDRLRALLRPPGYPAFLALHERLGVDLQSDARPIIWTQAVSSALLAGIVFALASAIFGHLGAGVLAGFLAAVSPTAIAAASLATPDSVYAVAFAGGFAAYVMVVCRATETRQRIAWASLAGVLFAVAVLLKPAVIYWPVLAVPALLAVRGFRRDAVRDAAIISAPLLIVVALWTNANYRRDGVATYSTIAIKNLSYDVVLRTDLAVALGQMPSELHYRRAADARGENDERIFRKPHFEPRRFQQRMSDDVRRGLTQHPLIAAQVLWSNLHDQLSTGWLWLDEQLPNDFTGRSVVRWMFDHTHKHNPLVAWWACVAAAVPIVVLRSDRRAVAPLALCALALVYIAAGTATTHGEGSRLLTAAEPLEILLVTGTVCHVADALLALLKAQASRQAAEQPSSPASMEEPA